MDERRAEHSAGEPGPDVSQPEASGADVHEAEAHAEATASQAAASATPWRSTPAASSAPAPAPRGHTGTIAGLLLLLVLLVAGVGTSPWWAPPLAGVLPWASPDNAADRDAREQIATLTGRLGKLEQRAAAPAPPALPPEALAKTTDQLAAVDRRLGAVEQQLTQQSQSPAASADLAALQQSMQREATAQAQLGERVSALESKKPDVDPGTLASLQDSVAKLSADLASLTQRLDKLTASAADDGRTDQALVLALGQLRQAMAGSAPFGDALGAASGLTQHRPEVKAALAPLADAAAQGVPSLPLLRERFARIAGEIANANETPATEWGPWLGEKLRALFAARRVGAGAAGGSSEAAVATAEGALDQGDLAGAVSALEALRGAAAATAKPWLDDAHRRLAADAALAKAQGLVTARLAQGPVATGSSPAGSGTGSGTDSAEKP
ncbi:MAG: hypothetical protein JO255_19655 [Alphaproteobacteria bacterium]|nr:hypothetical protein [Alphaproteobacteria bacterium]